ncbi:hypothetical protein Tdes44962_MAKER00558 [Teratosphaeria destructans]|uniref:Uncharacterized protein n=1 Tax=Teratosphaeria destructans TaxID=418781 RepID=A0A9W7SPZ8_9PEZI|nr:hypothetical protein Tdes44962_MAKER00558 [Teratosphaeria destructans]
MDALLRHTEDLKSIVAVAFLDTVLRVWDFTTESSSLRQWLIDFTYPGFAERDIKQSHDAGKDLPLVFCGAVQDELAGERNRGPVRKAVFCGQVSLPRAFKSR